MSKFAAVRTRYYKHKAAVAVMDHAHSERNGFTRSQNVHNEFSKDNTGGYLKDSKSVADAYLTAREMHEEVTGKKTRSDMNTLFEHVVVLSVEQYEKLEQELGVEGAKQQTKKALADYSKTIKDEFGFAMLGFDLHLDEGTKADDGTVQRNIHAHVMFYNYDFKKRVAPLRGLMKKGKNPKTGKTNQLNENFEKMQDIVARSFNDLGFERGVSHGIDNPKHLEKAEFVKKELANSESMLNALSSEIQKSKHKLIEVTRRLKTVENEAVKRAVNAVKPILKSVEQLVSRIDEKSLRNVLSAIKHYDKDQDKNNLPGAVLDDVEAMISPFRKR